jgi:hypothetical protein
MGGGNTGALDPLQGISSSSFQDQQQSQYYQSLIGGQSAIGIGADEAGSPSTGVSAYSGAPPPYYSSLGEFSGQPGLFG